MKRTQLICLFFLFSLMELSAMARVDTPYARFPLPAVPAGAVENAKAADRKKAIESAWRLGAEQARSGESFFFEIRSHSEDTSRLAPYMPEEKRACLQYGTPQKPLDATLLHWCQAAYEATASSITKEIMGRDGDTDLCTQSFLQGMIEFQAHNKNCDMKDSKFAAQTNQLGCFTLGYVEAQRVAAQQEAAPGSVPAAKDYAKVATPQNKSADLDINAGPSRGLAGSPVLVAGGT